MRLLVLICILFCTMFSMGYEDLGSLKLARKEYPQIFKTGSVNIITINKIPCYVFSGEAEQAFSGDLAESERELYEEAVLSAKSNFYEFLSRKNKKTVISMTGCRTLYQFNDAKAYTVILCVPQDSVKVTKKEKVLSLLGATSPKASESQTTVDKSGFVVEKAATIMERRICKYRKRIEKNPCDVISIISLADLYSESENYNAAFYWYRKAVVELEKDQFFDLSEKARIILNCAKSAEKVNKNHLALKYYHLLLQHKCTPEQRQEAVSAIHRLKAKSIQLQIDK